MIITYIGSKFEDERTKTINLFGVDFELGKATEVPDDHEYADRFKSHPWFKEGEHKVAAIVERPTAPKPAVEPAAVGSVTRGGPAMMRTSSFDELHLNRMTPPPAVEPVAAPVVEAPAVEVPAEPAPNAFEVTAEAPVKRKRRTQAEIAADNAKLPN